MHQAPDAASGSSTAFPSITKAPNVVYETVHGGHLALETEFLSLIKCGT